ncbi:hypothetical protein B0H66DRAFT_644080 [Apodospora peruviana]|uniref:Uncharacterized protein n=1 Tax=Apodospora peruviana TaxID=516989 RepID=A0AAE0HU49_9PEZI|nr:hypothetical protein B0H66DRAFT_644080 [Apodospora peruviana]
MRLFTIFPLGLLGLHGVSTFDITIYNNVAGCNAKDDTMYRIVTGVSDGTCYTFDEEMPGTDCAQYSRGGWEGPDGCTKDSLLPKSVIQRNGNVPCIFYSQKNCEGALIQETGTCVDGTPLGLDSFSSFSCSWDGTVDILGNVGCHDGVSTNVCINDCNCVCNGQRLFCPENPLRCTEMTIANCVKNCNCINP